MDRTRWLLLLLLAITAACSQNWFQTMQDADLMLSGKDFNNTGGALLFNHPSGIATDGARFLLCDRFNNRVLIWNTLPARWDAPPDVVLGQPSFVANDPGTTRSGLNWPGNVSVGSNGVVVVADTENDRILIWLSFPLVNAQPADRAVSLPRFSPPGEDRYEWPWGVWTDGTRLIATATHGKTILFWNWLPASDTQPPSYVIKLPEFGTLRNISTDGATYLFVGDHNANVGGNQSGTFFWNSFPVQANQPYDWFFNEWIKGAKTAGGGLIAGGMATVYLWDTFPSSPGQMPDIRLRNSYYQNGGGPDVAIAGGRLYVNNYNGNNVQVYDSIPQDSTRMPDFALGSPRVDYNTLDSINYIQNPVVASDGMVLVATSDFDRELWIWRTVNPNSGQAPDVKVLLSRNGDLAPWDNAFWNGILVAAGRNRVGIWDSLPLHGEPPVRLYSDHIGSALLDDLRGAALDDRFFYLGNRNGTVFLWRGIPASDTVNPSMTLTLPYAALNNLHSDGAYLTATVQDIQPSVYVFRVSTLDSGNLQPWRVVARSSSLPLNLPGSAIAFNGSLAIANTCGSGVLLWRDIADAGDTSRVVILGQPGLYSNEPGIGRDRLFWPASLCAYRNELWLGEFKFSSRILRFSYPAQGINDEPESGAGCGIRLSASNPFRRGVAINYSLSTPGPALLEVFDPLGQRKAVLVNEWQSAGSYSVRFRAGDDGLAQGTYFVRLGSAGQTATCRIVLVK
jgi:hypothetical protein